MKGAKLMNYIKEPTENFHEETKVIKLEKPHSKNIKGNRKKYLRDTDDRPHHRRRRVAEGGRE